MSSSAHFSRLLVGQQCLLDTAMGVGPTVNVPRAARGVHGSAAARGPGSSAVPTLGSAGMKFNSSRWTNCGAEEGLSIFDMKGAMEALQNGPDEAATRRAHPAALAHAERVARAQSMGATLMGFKVFPDLTPARAFMWGTFLAVYTVGCSSYLVARSLDIKSVDDIKVKMQEYFAPYKASLSQVAQGARGQMELHQRPAVLQQLESFGHTVNHALSGKVTQVKELH